MVRHFNFSIVEWAKRIFSSKHDFISDDIIPNIQPTIEITPIVNIVRNATRATTGAGSVFVTPTDKDFYLTYTSFSNQSDVVADNTSIDMRATINGAVRRLQDLSKLTTTAFSGNISINFMPAIKIDRGTNIQINTSFTVGASTTSGVIAGYTVETTEGD